MIWGVEDLWQDAFSSIRLQLHAHIKKGLLWTSRSDYLLMLVAVKISPIAGSGADFSWKLRSCDGPAGCPSRWPACR